MTNRDDNRIAVERRRSASSPWLWIIGAIVLVAVVLLLLIPLFNEPEPIPPGNATIPEITGGLDAYVGQSVLLTGEVQEVLSPNAFVLQGEARDAAAADASILVIGAQQNLAAIDEQLLNDRVFVGGIVREFDIAAIEEEVGYDLDDALFADWDGRPVLVATAIQNAGAPAAAPTNVTISEILQAPDQYMGTNAIVAGQAIDLLTPDAVVMVNPAEANADPVDAGLLVLSAEQGLWGEIGEDIVGQRALAAGIVRNFQDIATIEAELGYDLDDALFEPYVGKPVLIATAFQAGSAVAVPGAVPGDFPEYTNVTVADIAGDPQAYLGQNVAVQAGVEEVISPVAFWLDEDALLDGGIDDDLLVVSATQDAPLDFGTLEDQAVIVTGTVRQFDLAAIEQEIGYDLDDALFADVAGRPVIVATAVETAAAAE